MKMSLALAAAAVLLWGTGCCTKSHKSCMKRCKKSPKMYSRALIEQKAEQEVEKHYSAASPEVQEFILWTARTFGPHKIWLTEDAFVSLSDEEREKKVKYIVALLKEGEYGRHLSRRLAEAGALKDKRLVPGLMKVAAYAKGKRYDCAPKCVAVSSLARQESDEAVPLLISLVDHGNLNTRMWARAALARKSGKYFGKDKKAWAKWWESQGHKPVDKKYLEPWKNPDSKK